MSSRKRRMNSAGRHRGARGQTGVRGRDPEKGVRAALRGQPYRKSIGVKAAADIVDIVAFARTAVRIDHAFGPPANRIDRVGLVLSTSRGNREVETFVIGSSKAAMIVFLLWCILFVLCWPLALLALLLYPVVWLLLLPFRLVGVAVGGVLALVWAIVTLPFRVGRRLT